MKFIALLFPYRTHLENELKQQRADFQDRIAEKNLQIRMLRGELAAAKATKLEPALPTITNGPPPIPEMVNQATPLDWQGELNKMLQEEEDGIRSRGRIQEHEQSADDGA